MRCEVAAERFLAAVREAAIETAEAAFAITVSIGGVALPRRGRSRADCVERAQEGSISPAPPVAAVSSASCRRRPARRSGAIMRRCRAN